MMKIPKRLHTKPTSARDWYVMLIELGSRVVDDLRSENPYGWTFR